MSTATGKDIHVENMDVEVTVVIRKNNNNAGMVKKHRHPTLYTL